MPKDASSTGITTDPLHHISGLGANLHKLSDEQRDAVRSLAETLKSNEYAVANADYLTDAVLVKFLIARDWSHDKALAMIDSALAWRTRRPCHRWILAAPTKESGLPAAVTPDTKRLRTMKEGATTGKVRVSGTDKHGRPVMVFDNTVENADCPEEMIEYLAYNMELCQRTALLAGKGADKMMLFLHMKNFNVFSQPPMAVTKEVIRILSAVYPESLGCAVLLDTPAYFSTLWRLVSQLVDAKTRGKVYCLSGSIDDGSENDKLMRRVLGDDWKLLTGAGSSVVAQGFSKKHKKLIDASVGFDIDAYWPTVMHREQAFATYLARTRTADTFKHMSSIADFSAPVQSVVCRATSAPVSGDKPSITLGRLPIAMRAPQRSFAADVAALAPSLPAFLWILDQEYLWHGVRKVPSFLISSSDSSRHSALLTAAGLLLELLLVLISMLASVQVAHTAVQFQGRITSGASSGSSASTSTVFKLLAIGAFFGAAFLLLESLGSGSRRGGSIAEDIALRAASAVALARAWSVYFVGTNVFILLASRK